MRTRPSARAQQAASHWERYGAEDPYYGVLSEDGFSGPLDDAAREAFFASGQSRVDLVLKDVRRNLEADFDPRSVLDFGCGVGRLAIPFARRSARVVGVDVSPSMRREAAANAEREGLTNLTWASPEEMAALPDRFDLVHSVLVFQHIPTSEGMRQLGVLLGLLEAGGIAAVHVPFRAWSRLATAYWWAMRTVPGAHGVWNLLRRRPWSAPRMEMHPYDLDSILLLATSYGCGPMLVKHHPARGRTDWHAASLYLRRYAEQRPAG